MDPGRQASAVGLRAAAVDDVGKVARHRRDNFFFDPEVRLNAQVRLRLFFAHCDQIPVGDVSDS